MKEKGTTWKGMGREELLDRKTGIARETGMECNGMKWNGME
jgi:hypothetical protein